MVKKEDKDRWTLKDLLKQVWSLYKEKKFIHLINAGFVGGMAFVYFENFIFAFGGKEIDPEMAHSVIMIKVILVAFFVFRGLTYAVERLSKADELDQVIRKDTLQISYMFLVIAVIGSLLSWSWHENLETVFHCVFLSLILSYAFFHFFSSIKHMNFMAKPSLFELDSED